MTDAKADTRSITLECGDTIVLNELTMRDMAEFEEQGHDLGQLSDGKMKPMAYLVWLMCRGDSQKPNPDWDTFLDTFTIRDFLSNQDTIRGFVSPLESAGTDTGTG